MESPLDRFPQPYPETEPISAAHRCLPRWIAAATVLVVILAGAVFGLLMPDNASYTTHAANPSTAAVTPPPEPRPAPETFAPAPGRRAYGIDIGDCQLVTRKVKRSENLSTPMPSSRQLNAEQIKPFAASVTQYTAILNNPGENLILARQN